MERRHGDARTQAAQKMPPAQGQSPRCRAFRLIHLTCPPRGNLCHGAMDASAAAVAEVEIADDGTALATGVSARARWNGADSTIPSINVESWPSCLSRSATS